MKGLFEKFKSFQAIDFLTIGVVLICLIVSVAMFLRGSGESEDAETILAENRATIVNLQAKRDALMDDKSNLISEEDAAKILRSAGVAGMAVAALQTEYQDCTVFRDGDTVPIEEKITKQAESVGAYLTPGSQGARVPWFTSSASELVSSSRFTWRFMTNYGFTGESIDCLWLCVDSSEQLVAFATGTYLANSDKFDDVHFYATQYGNSTYRLPEEASSIWMETIADDTGHEIFPGEQGAVVDPENPDGANPENPDGENQENPDGENPENPDVTNPENPDVTNPENPDGVNSENPDGENQENPDGANTENPDGTGSDNPGGGESSNPGDTGTPATPSTPSTPGESGLPAGLDWASEFEDAFKESKEYRDQVQAGLKS